MIKFIKCEQLGKTKPVSEDLIFNFKDTEISEEFSRSFKRQIE